MSITEALGRITTIQSTLAQVSGTSQRTATAAAPAASSNTAASAVAQLSAVTPSGPAAGVPNGAGATSAEAFSGALANARTQDPAPATKGAAGAAELKRADGAQAADKVGAVKPHGKTDGSDVVATAKKYLGVPYVWGGNNPKIGLDCSSLVQHTFRDLGIDLPRVARQQATVGTAVPSLSQAKPGDLIVTRGGGHIGIYLGDNKMIHAPQPGEKVSIRELFETDKDIMTIRRVVPAESPAPTPASTPTAGAAALALQQAAFAGAAS